MAKRIPWCKSHYRVSFCKDKAKELRKQGYKVSLGYYLKENGETYCKIYLEMDLNYFILDVLESVVTKIRHGGMAPIEALMEYKERIRELCKEYRVPIRIELAEGRNRIYAIVNNDYELSVSY